MPESSVPGPMSPTAPKPEVCAPKETLDCDDMVLSIAPSLAPWSIAGVGTTHDGE